jgi:hypothetical protein
VAAAAQAAGAANNASGLAAALAAAQNLSAPVITLAGHTSVVSWSSDADLSLLCGYLTANTRSLHLASLPLKLAYGPGTPGGVGGPVAPPPPPPGSGAAAGSAAIVYPCVTAYLRYLEDFSLVNVSVQVSALHLSQKPDPTPCTRTPQTPPNP